MNKELTPSMFAAVCFTSLMLLTSCGSGSSTSTSTSNIGGDDSITPTPTPTPTPAQFLRGGIEAADAAQLRSALQTAAAATPTSGSVSQASPDTTVAVTIPGEFAHYTWSLDRSGVARDIMSEVSEEAVNASNSLGVFTNIAFDNVVLDDDIAEYYVSIFTDFTPDANGDDSDYLSGGFWLYVPEDETNPVVGAFADGNSPFSVGTLISAGSATTLTFSGVAAGLCDCASASDTAVASRVFTADAALTASFGPGSNDDRISGSITGFVVDEIARGSNSPTISLQAATLNNTAAGGFFAGETMIVGQSATGQGNWGGEFYGAGNDDPSSVGGTFGATAGGETYVGAFGAHLVDQNQ